MIVVNDNERPFVEGVTVRDVLLELDPQLPAAVVKINDAHVPRADWTTRHVHDGDIIVVVHFIAGG